MIICRFGGQKVKRREFLTATGGVALGLGCKTSGSLPAQSIDEEGCHWSGHARQVEQLGGMPLENLLDLYRADLFEDFLPFMERHIIDHKHGGFICRTDRDGTHINEKKYIWYEGRGIWVYSFLYRHLTQNPKHLEVARRSVDFIMRHEPDDEHLWPLRYSRKGEVLLEAKVPEDRIYGDLFVAEGLAEYAAASGEKVYFEKAKGIIRKCMRIYDRSDYYPTAGRDYLGDDYPLLPGPRILGHWMVFLRAATQMLRTDPSDLELQSVAVRSLDAIMNDHFNPRFDLINEILNHDLSRNEAFEQFVYPGHAAETLWMVMDEARRVSDQGLFRKAAERFFPHLEVSWDDVYGGFFPGLNHVDNNDWNMIKPLWTQEEAMVGAMMLIEMTGSLRAKEWFNRTNAYVRENMVLKRHGFPLWDLLTDRQSTFKRDAKRVGNYHHPRHLMLNILSLQRLIENGGRPRGWMS